MHGRPRVSLHRLVRQLGRIVGLAAILAAVSGLGAGLFGLAYGACFAVISGTLLGVIPCGIYFALAGAVAGAVVGAFGTLVGGDTSAGREPPRPERREQPPGGAPTPARTGTVRVWTEEEHEDEVFSTCPPDDAGGPTNHRKERPWT